MWQRLSRHELIMTHEVNHIFLAHTFKGIEKAIRETQEELRVQSVRIYVRRGGPNYQEGAV